MADIQSHISKRGKRSVFSRPSNVEGGDEAIAAWKSDFDRIRHIFEARSFISALRLLFDFLFLDRTFNTRRRRYP